MKRVKNEALPDGWDKLIGMRYYSELWVTCASCGERYLSMVTESLPTGKSDRRVYGIVSCPVCSHRMGDSDLEDRFCPKGCILVEEERPV